ncbi:MAG TPA: 50S ribosomal protein L30 [Candidatus Nanoarchaeia archaeon]|nr:50S ribosomal protein L30 [Candidatus Nanoarchaeia archaeon]
MSPVKKAAPAKKAVAKVAAPETKLLAVIRVRGGFKMRKGFKDTFIMMRLNQKHHCVLLHDLPVNKGMILKLQDYITWGEIDASTLKALIAKRGRLDGNKRVTLKDKELDSLVSDLMSGKKKLIDAGIKPVLRLSPPSKGWDHGTIKLRYPRGALGPRGSEVNELLKRMI